MLERIERLEANNGRLLNVILPMVEAMTQQQLPHDYSSTQPRPRHEGLLSRADDSDDDDIDPLREHRDQNEELEDYDLDVRDSRGYDGFSSPQHHGPRQHGFSNVAARPQRGPHNIPRRVASRNAFGLYTTSQSSGDFDQYIPQRAASRNATRPYTASQSSGDFGTNTSASVHRPYTRRGSLNISSRSNWELGTNDLPAVAAFDHPPTTRQGGGRYTLHSNREFDTNPIATPINRPPTRHGGESYNTTASHSNWELNTNNPIAAAAATSRPPTRHGRSPTSNGGSNFASRMAAAVRRQQSSRGSQQELTTTDNNDGYDDNDLTGLDTLEPVMRDLLTSERDLTSEMEIVQEEDDDDDDEEAMLGWGI
ncbi:hypothetical protein B0H63DRAFT_457262 [Podospora didyma]|uniref:Uncharacterized protein n=1 Tax=Podospora didyma TaxID=330526 RepID=A0AAE0P494_9PEZI|nr:hypothetical protein B0H63DRAFT_457262 [Podospora didyma]